MREQSTSSHVTVATATSFGRTEHGRLAQSPSNSSNNASSGSIHNSNSSHSNGGIAHSKGGSHSNSGSGHSNKSSSPSNSGPKSSCHSNSDGKGHHHHHNNNNSNTGKGGKCFGGPCIDSEEEEEDWEEDLGIGKLVIDLDAESSNSGNSSNGTKGSNGSSGKCGNGAGGNNTKVGMSSSPQKAGGKIVSSADSGVASGHVVADKGLKMKIKRNGNGKSSASLASSTTTAASGVGVSLKPEVRIGVGDSRLYLSTTSSDGAGAGSASLQTTVDRLKHSLAEKERNTSGSAMAVTSSSASMVTSSSSSGKNRSGSKKDRAAKAKTGGGSSGSSSADAQHHATTSATAFSATSVSGAAVAVAATTSGMATSGPTPVTSDVTVDLDRLSVVTLVCGVKRDVNAAHDPYEFNAKVEDRIGVPVKKIKVEKVEQSTPDRRDESVSDIKQHRDVGIETAHVGVITDPDCLGPCEPGTSVVLEGIVWNETENGLLVVNVTWRGKTYVGTLMDATKHDWAPPRLNCDSPTSDYDSRTPKGRGKRGRNQPAPKPAENGSDRKLRSNRRTGGPNNTGHVFAMPPSPSRCESLASGKRKARSDPDGGLLELPKTNKRSRMEPSNGGGGTVSGSNNNSNGNNNSGNGSGGSASSSNGNNGSGSGAAHGNGISACSGSITGAGEMLIECPEPNCAKKYRHINGLRYHQSHAHTNPHLTGHNPPTPPTPTGGNAGSEEEEGMASRRKTDGGCKKETSIKSETGCTTPVVKVKEEPVDRTDSSPTTSTTSPVTSSVTSSVITSTTTSTNPRVTKDDRKPEIVTAPAGSSAADMKKIGAKHANVSLTPVTVAKTTFTSGSMVYQISGTQIGLVATPSGGGSLVNQTHGHVTISTLSAGAVATAGMTSSVSVKPVAAALTSLPLTVTSPAKHDVSDRKKKSGSDGSSKSDKHRNKSTPNTTRPIMPAPQTAHVTTVSHTPISSQAGMAQVSTVTSQLKPIQPKPTVLGEPSKVNPALASLKEMKEKKPKKKKNKDKDREKRKDGSHHDKKNKVSVTSVIKTLPQAAAGTITVSQAKPDGQQVAPKSSSEGVKVGQQQQQQQQQQVQQQQQRQPEVTPPKIVQTPVKAQPASEIPAANKDSCAPPQLEKQQPVNLSKERPGGTNGTAITTPTTRTPQTLAPVAKVTDGQGRSNTDQDAHSPAYSDISDANESAPTLEKETQPLQGEPQAAERPPSAQTQEHGVYSPYYGQPPFLTPAVPASVAQDGKDSGQVALKSSGKAEAKDSAKVGANASGSLTASGENKEAPAGTNTAGGSRPSSRSGQDQKAGPASDRTAVHVQPQLQKTVYSGHGQYQYMGQCYTLTPNYVPMIPPNAEYRERLLDEQRRRQEQLQQQQQQRQSQQSVQQQQQQHSKAATSGTQAPPSVKTSVSQAQLQKQAQQQQHQNAAQQVQLQTISRHPSPQQHSPQIQQHRQQAHSQHQQPKQQQQVTPNAQSQQHQQARQHNSQQQPTSCDGCNSSNSGNNSNKSHSAAKVRAPPAAGAAASEQNRRPKDDSSKSELSQKAPPSLIPDREREEQQRRRERELRQKQNENRQILKENIELKEQMDRKCEAYDPSCVLEKQRERYLMFHQQRLLVEQRYVPTDSGAGKPREPVPISPKSEAPSSGAGGGKQTERREAEVSSNAKSAKDVEERPNSAECSPANNNNNTNSPRTTPKLNEQLAGPQLVGAAGPVSYAQYYSPFVPQGPPPPPGAYGGSGGAPQIQYDPGHPSLYPGVSPAVIGYASPTYIHPAQIRYHVTTTGGESGGGATDKMLLVSPSGARTEGKALDLLQQHASQYYGSGSGTPNQQQQQQHKIHELQDLAKRGTTVSGGSADKIRTSGSPTTTEADRPESRGSAGPEAGKTRSSPPAQRHLHTHHHTHVMGTPAYPTIQYGPYGAAIMSSPPGAPIGPIAQHPFVQK